MIKVLELPKFNRHLYIFLYMQLFFYLIKFNVIFKNSIYSIKTSYRNLIRLFLNCSEYIELQSENKFFKFYRAFWLLDIP